MKKSGKYILLFLSLVVFTAAANAQKVNSFSVKQAVDYANNNSVQVKNALLDILIQKQTNRDITSIALPQINGTGSVTDYLQIPTTLLPGEIAGQPAGTYKAVKFGTKWTAGAGVSLSQLVFDGQVFIALKARNGTIELQTTVEQITEENIKANIHKIYYQLVLSKTQIELLDANIDRLKKLNHDVTVMYDNGFTERVDIDKLTVQIANLQTEKLKAQNMIQNGYHGLKLLMGMPMKDSLVLTDTLTDDQIKESALETTQYSYKDRKDYQAMVITNRLNGLNVRRYKLSQIPTFALVGSYNVQAQRNEFDFFGKGDWYNTSYVGLQMKVPIFNGFALKSRIQKAKLELKKTENQTEALEISIDKDVEDAKNNFATAIASMDFQKKNMALAEKVYGQTKKKYEIGTGSSTEINTAQLDLKTAQTNFINAMYDAIIAKVDFLKATGKL
ncbi:MAG: TolC family protein [Ferruginibacter sp.]